MAAVTIDDIISAAQVESDKANDPSIQSGSWFIFANSAIEELWRKIRVAQPSYFDTFGDVTIASSATPYIDLTASPFVVDPTSGGWVVRNIRLVEKDPTASIPLTVVKRSLQTKDVFRYPRGYILSGKKLYIDPPSVAPGNYRVYYAAGPAILSTGNALPAELIPYREYLEVATACRALRIEESDTGPLNTHRGEMLADIISTVSQQDDANPDRIQDTLANDELQRWGLIFPGGWF
jgi:hypothetical protein